jgi:hypothetical protein
MKKIRTRERNSVKLHFVTVPQSLKVLEITKRAGNSNFSNKRQRPFTLL